MDPTGAEARPLSVWRRRGYFLLHSGQGHWSQPQPVHALRIMLAFTRR